MGPLRLLREGFPMGRGRAKAKQTKVARSLSTAHRRPILIGFNKELAGSGSGVSHDVDDDSWGDEQDWRRRSALSIRSLRQISRHPDIWAPDIGCWTRSPERLEPRVSAHHDGARPPSRVLVDILGDSSQRPAVEVTRVRIAIARSVSSPAPPQRPCPHPC